MQEFATRYYPHFSQYVSQNKGSGSRNSQINETSLENTMRYIFEVLHHTCYFLCVYGGGKQHKLYKLMTKTSSPIIDNIFKAEFNRKIRRNDAEENPELKLSKGQIETIEYTLSKPYRVMGCIVKSINVRNEQADSGESTEYNHFFDDLRLPCGTYIFNLNDSMILEKNDNDRYVFPWDILPKQQEIGTFGITPNFLPIFSLSGRRGYVDIPIPNYDDIPSYNYVPNGNTNYNYMANINNNMANHEKYNISWAMKTPKAIFRGGATGCGYTTTTNQRLKLIKIVEDAIEDPTIPHNITDLFNVGIVNNDKKENVLINTLSVRNDPKYHIGVMNTDILSAEWVSMEQQSNCKYIIFIDGNVNAYRLLHTFLTGSLIIRIKSTFTSWFEPLIRPYDIHSTTAAEDRNNSAHYIYVNEDLSNLFSVLEWCESHSDICKRIAENALIFARMVSQPEFPKKYTEMMLWLSKGGVTAVTKNTESLDSDVQPVRLSSTPPLFEPHSPSMSPPNSPQLFEPHSPSMSPPPSYEPHSPSASPPQSMSMSPPPLYESTSPPPLYMSSSQQYGLPLSSSQYTLSHELFEIKSDLDSIKKSLKTKNTDTYTEDKKQEHNILELRDDDDDDTNLDLGVSAASSSGETKTIKI